VYSNEGYLPPVTLTSKSAREPLVCVVSNEKNPLAVPPSLKATSCKFQRNNSAFARSMPTKTNTSVATATLSFLGPEII
jgi:hypothetical protein